MDKKVWIKFAYVLASALVLGVFLYLIQIPSAKDFLTKIENEINWEAKNFLVLF